MDGSHGLAKVETNPSDDFLSIFGKYVPMEGAPQSRERSFRAGEELVASLQGLDSEPQSERQ